MAREGLEKAKSKKPGEAAELIEEAKRLDHHAIADIAPESEDADRDDPEAAAPTSVQPKFSGFQG
ncbi:hypothetical protein N825_29400 [Skermanella stibiiresistens SB22]|uniref:Uncharacterized protein n=1 Tax=Skermanella stibiiresistens SB22 TaxID=1385369 RepID=W9GXH7_9PROT|nr:hypothetical protein [Skermanella stibiiresistens]EWY36173.1 hypothetical protein N825_29400 [Skermanella stibiiresistens SB22]